MNNKDTNQIENEENLPSQTEANLPDMASMNETAVLASKPVKKSRWLLKTIFVLLLAGGGLAAYSWSNGTLDQHLAMIKNMAGPVDKSEQTKLAEPAETVKPAVALLPSIYVISAKMQKISKSISGSGFIAPVEQVFIQPEISGMAVSDVLVEIGSTVKAGDTLVALKNETLLLEKSRLEATLMRSKAAITQLEAGLAEAKANAVDPVQSMQRSEKLVTSGTISTARLDQAKATSDAALARVNSANANLEAGRLDIKVAEAQINDVNLRLERTKVTAPVNGIIMAKNVKIGDIAAPSAQPMFAIIRDGKVELRIDISEVDMGLIKVGQPVSIKTAGSQKVLDGFIRLIDPTIDISTHLGSARIEIADNSLVRSGMFAEADILIEEKSAIVVPISSVSIDGDKASVLKIVDGQIKLTNVELGIQQAGIIEIVQGLEVGEQIVEKAGAFVRDGDRVNPIEQSNLASK